MTDIDTMHSKRMPYKDCVSLYGTQARERWAACYRRRGWLSQSVAVFLVVALCVWAKPGRGTAERQAWAVAVVLGHVGE